MKSKSYIVFQLNNEEYGIETSYVQEILRVPDHFTHLPNMPSYVEGVINIRGKVIPVIDLKKRFDLIQTCQSSDNRLIILNIDSMLVALIIDDVSEIINIDEDSIENVNSIISNLGLSSLEGIGRIENRLILLVNAKSLNVEVFSQSL